MKKVLFIDRDGTLIEEPKDTQQIDSYERLRFLPGVIGALSQIVRETEYELVMVTNQDGLGTSSFPEETFWGPHTLMIETLRGEGIEFKEILIDRSFESDNLPTRKPGTGLLKKYIYGNYDLSRSFVIGDRDTDAALAFNLGATPILLRERPLENDAQTITAKSWVEIASIICSTPRTATIRRQTKETDVQVSINLDGSGQCVINTGIGFFDHMLSQIFYHSRCNGEITVTGDLAVDEHHTIEDTAIAIGEAFNRALGARKGIYRYGFVVPMDEAKAEVSLDFSGRSYLVWNASFLREKIGEMPTEMFVHFFRSFCDAARCTLHVSSLGDNEHHKIESIFKAFGKSLRYAVKKDPELFDVPSTKGVL